MYLKFQKWLKENKITYDLMINTTTVCTIYVREKHRKQVIKYLKDNDRFVCSRTAYKGEIASIEYRQQPIINMKKR